MCPSALRCRHDSLSSHVDVPAFLLRSGRGGLSAFLSKPFLAAQARDQFLTPQSPQYAIPGENTLLVPSVSEFDFGTLARGGRKSATFQLRNPGIDAVEVARVQVSCDCLRVELNRYALSAGEVANGVIAVDFSDDLTFVGTLLLEASAQTKQSESAFLMVVKVMVR